MACQEAFADPMEETLLRQRLLLRHPYGSSASSNCPWILACPSGVTWLVPGGRIELPLSCENQILSLARLPVPPSGQRRSNKRASLF